MTKESTAKISDYLDEGLITFLDVETREEAVDRLFSLLDSKGKLPNREAFSRAIHEREEIASTGIGIGVALPHAKLPEYDEFFIAIGIQKEQGIDWKALDGLPVRIIFMIGGPQSRQTEYLNILSMITTAVKKENIRKKLLNANAPADVFAIFDDLESIEG